MKKILGFVRVLGVLEAGSLLVLSNVWAEELYVPIDKIKYLWLTH